MEFDSAVIFNRLSWISQNLCDIVCLRYSLSRFAMTKEGEIIMQNGNTAAIYCRLSRDEDTNQESNSIQSQRLMLNEFAKRQGFQVVGEYIDDGFSGTNYDHPDFKRMMEDAE